MMSKQLLGLYNLFVEVFDYNATSDVVTPLELAREMVRGLPTTGTMLVPGSGIGTFAVAAVLEGRDPCTITCVEYNKAYSAIGARILERFGIRCVHADFLSQDLDVKFDVIVGNPPYQAPKKEGKKGLGGNNSLFVKFIEKSLDLLNPGGYLSMLTPASALTKSTVNGEPTTILKKMMNKGSLLSLNLDVKSYFNVGTFIGHWTYLEGESQGEVSFTKDAETVKLPVSDLYYCPPNFTEVEFKLFQKIIKNKNGNPLKVTRGKSGKDYTMNRLGYPKIQKGGNGVLGFDALHSEFMLSQLGLWLLDYVRRHDQFIYHNLLTGIYIPEEGFNLTTEEQNFIHGNVWRNFGVKEEKCLQP